MAVIVPFLVNAGLGMAGITGAAATIASVATSVVFQVSGINDKINKAASKVFGEDLVNVANIAGAVYGAWNGGFSLDPAKEFLGVGEAASGMSGAADAAAAMDAANMADVAGGLDPTMGQIGAEQSNVVNSITGNSIATPPPGAATPTASTGVNALNNQAHGVDSMKVADAATTPTKVQPVSKYDLVPNNAAGSSSAASRAASANATGINATASGIGIQAPPGALTPQPSVFDKLLSKVGDKTIAGVIQGGATAAGNYMTAQDRLKAEEEARRINPTTRRGYTYKAA